MSTCRHPACQAKHKPVEESKVDSTPIPVPSEQKYDHDIDAHLDMHLAKHFNTFQDALFKKWDSYPGLSQPVPIPTQSQPKLEAHEPDLFEPKPSKPRGRRTESTVDTRWLYR